MVVNFLADTYVKRGSTPVFSNPKDFGLDYEDVEIIAEDGVKISGWLIKGGTDKVVIESHFACVAGRCGYTPKGKTIKPYSSDINFLRQAKYLVEAGYSVLMYDIRNHGESGDGTKPWITMGSEESKDVIACVKYISEHPTYKNASIGLLSICMGSGATMYGFGREKGGLRDYKNIKALISVQPVNFDVSMRNNGMPQFLNKRIVKKITKKVGEDLTQKSFVPLVKNINVPTMIIQNENDPWTEIDHVKDIYNQLTVEKEYVNLVLDKHRFAAYNYIGTHSEEVLRWFNKYIN